MVVQVHPPVQSALRSFLHGSGLTDKAFLAPFMRNLKLSLKVHRKRSAVNQSEGKNVLGVAGSNLAAWSE